VHDNNNKINLLLFFSVDILLLK